MHFFVAECLKSASLYVWLWTNVMQSTYVVGQIYTLGSKNFDSFIFILNSFVVDIFSHFLIERCCKNIIVNLHMLCSFYLLQLNNN